MLNFYPMQISINGNSQQFNAQTLTIAQLVAEMKLSGKRIAIECNGNIVPKSQFETTLLADGDRLEIVGAVGGG